MKYARIVFHPDTKLVVAYYIYDEGDRMIRAWRRPEMGTLMVADFKTIVPNDGNPWNLITLGEEFERDGGLVERPVHEIHTVGLVSPEFLEAPTYHRESPFDKAA
jgi:hypothetical protein